MSSGQKEICFRSIRELAALIRERHISSVEVTDAVLARIEEFGPGLNCYITVLGEQARKRAKGLDRLLASGSYLGPLHGVPVALKDNIATAGVRTTAGSRILANWIPEHDATVVRHLKQAGAVLVGKASMHEFAYGDCHPDYGETRNPWDPSRWCGASSSGSACSVAAGLAFGSLGTDTGGSVRLPAGFCGVVGLKPSYGVISRNGVIPVSPNLDHVGLVGRTVEDVALQFAVLARFDESDPGSVHSASLDFQRSLQCDLQTLVVGVPRPQDGDLLNGAMREGYELALTTLESVGATLVQVDLPDYALARTVMWTISAAEAAEYHRGWLRTRRTDYSEGVWKLIETGEFVPATEYIHAQRVREKLRLQAANAFELIDVVAMPLIPAVAWPIGARTVQINGKSQDVMNAITRYTALFNLTGQPAIALPCGFDSEGLPLSFQLVGRTLGDDTLLRVAYALSELLSHQGPQRVPPYAPSLAA